MASTIQQFLKEHGISEVEAIIPDMAGVARGKLMPADIDAYLSLRGPTGRDTIAQVGAPEARRPGGEVAGGPFKEEPLTQKQRLLSSRLVRGSQLVVPGTISVVANWEPIERLRRGCPDDDVVAVRGRRVDQERDARTVGGEVGDRPDGLDRVGADDALARQERRSRRSHLPEGEWLSLVMEHAQGELSRFWPSAATNRETTAIAPR